MNPRFIAEIAEILNDFLPKRLYALDFTTEQYKTLLKKLAVDTDQKLFEEKKGSIRKGIVKYFANTNQSIELQVTFASFALKKQFLDPSKSEEYDRMLHRNSSILLDIYDRKSDFSPVPYIISIPGEIRNPILNNFLLFDTNVDYVRQVIRQQINQIFNLDTKDIIFFLRGRLTIRIYTPPKRFAEGVDKRFAGESVEDMEAMYQTYFPNGAWEHIESFLDEVLEEKLNFGVIDNFTFTRTFIAVFRSMIEILLLEIMKKSDHPRIEGFTGYVLRQNFHDIFIYTAKNLLLFVEKRDKNAESFIKFFADEIVIDNNGNKIQKYAIIDTKQQRWNYSSIVSIIMQYKQVKLKIAAQKETIQNTENEFLTCQSLLIDERNNTNNINIKLVELEEKITENEAAIERLKHKKGNSSEDAISLKSQINRLNYHTIELLDERKKIFTQLDLNKNKLSGKTSELSRWKRKLDYEKESLKTYLEQMASFLESYDLITEALATVLTKR